MLVKEMNFNLLDLFTLCLYFCYLIRSKMRFIFLQTIRKDFNPTLKELNSIIYKIINLKKNQESLFTFQKPVNTPNF